MEIKKITKWTIPLYPFLFAVDFLISKDVPSSALPLLLAVSLLLTGVVFGGAYLLTKNIHWAGFVTFLFSIWALYYGTACAILVLIFKIKNILLFGLLFLVPWTLLFFFLGSRNVWHRAGLVQRLTLYLNTVTIVILLFYSYQMVRIENHAYILSPKMAASDAAQSLTSTTRPDIYYIILDGYARADILAEMYGYDNSEFIDFLASRGFYVAGQSQSNYIYTELSLASSLNMSYLKALPSSSTTRTTATKKLISDNQVRAILESQGYQLAAFTAPFYLTDITDADLFLSLKPNHARAIYLEAMLLPSSILAPLLWADLISPGGENYRDHQERVMYTFDQLGKIPELPGPTFVFAHIISPHPPYVFDRNGPLTPDEPFFIDWSSVEQDTGYREQLIYLNGLVEQAIDTILKKSATPPVIILQADHGPRTYNPQSADFCLKARASILNAYYLPGLEANPLYETITPVNTFRIVFNQYFGTHFELLDDKVYFSDWAQYNQFTDVTQGSQQPCP